VKIRSTGNRRAAPHVERRSRARRNGSAGPGCAGL